MRILLLSYSFLFCGRSPVLRSACAGAIRSSGRGDHRYVYVQFGIGYHNYFSNRRGEGI